LPFRFRASCRAANHVFDLDHAKGAQPVILFADRNIFAQREAMACKSVAALIIVRIAMDIVMESPMAAGLSDEVAALCVFIAPETRRPAFVAMGFPFIGIEQTLGVDGRNEFIAVVAASLRKVMIASQFQANLFKCHRFSPQSSPQHGLLESERP
jgi:hypothetical protein